MDQVKFLKAVFHEIYLVHSWILYPYDDNDDDDDDDDDYDDHNVLCCGIVNPLVPSVQ